MQSLYHKTLAELIADANLQISSRDRDKWRLTFPNVGELQGFPQFGKVLIMATDGLLAYYEVGFPSLWLGHLSAFTGPIAKEYVWEDDWDYVRRCHKVRVFKKRDGTYAIIPQDSFMDEYWEQHPRLTENEKLCYAALGDRRMRVSEFDKSLEQLNLVSVQAKRRATQSQDRVKTKRQELLASL
jgi:hypothetical protein